MRGVLTVGDVIDDVLVRPIGPIAPDTDTPSRIERVAGGSAANTACWLASIGTPATLVASVGHEDLQRHEALLLERGVTPRLKPTGRPTGTIVVLSEGESRAMLTDRGANEETSPADVTDLLLSTHGVLHVTGHVFAGPDRDAGWHDLFARAALLGLTTSVAPGSAGHLLGIGPDRFRRITAGVDLLIAGLEEAQLLTGHRDADAAALELAADHPLVVVTLGSAGSIIATSGGAEHVAAVPAEVVDVTGAGDAYAAGLLAALIGGATDAEAGARAAVLAALAVARVGARP